MTRSIGQGRRFRFSSKLTPELQILSPKETSLEFFDRLPELLTLMGSVRTQSADASETILSSYDPD